MADYADLGGFEFAGVKFSRWQTEHGTRKVTVESGRTAYPMNRDTAVAIHAFIEAERDEWAWTNDEHTEARRGRWTVEVRLAGYPIWHDDFGPGALADSDGPINGRGPAYLQACYVLSTFLAWKSAQEQPEEPTGLGAVVEVDGMRWSAFRTQRDYAHREWVSEDGSLAIWGRLTDYGPVTILSPGVDA